MSLAAPADRSAPRMIRAEDLFPEVDTAQGRVRGLTSDGVHAFKGLRYGADTGRARRFRAPEPPPTWSGVRDATHYGQYAPQAPSSRQRDYADMISFDLQGGGMGEDCLVLNLWTPSLDRNAKKPVIVHLHGGGWYGGSGNAPGCDGAMLARHGDAVVVTLNHRLGAFGFLDLSSLSSDYAHSGAIGMLDIVAGLRWLRENVESFGGDRSRVLVFGQSGGGAKTSTLMAMPKAAGLFHRAGVMSGSVLKLATPEYAAGQAERFLSVLGLSRAQIPRLHEMPMQQLLAAQVTLEMGDRARGEAPRSFAPVVHANGLLPRHPFDPDAPEVSAQVPMIIGTTLDERSYRTVNFDLDEAGLEAVFKQRVGADAALLLKEYRDEDPTASPYLLQVRLDTDMGFRRAGVGLPLAGAEPRVRRAIRGHAWRRHRPEPARHPPCAERPDGQPASPGEDDVVGVGLVRRQGRPQQRQRAALAELYAAGPRDARGRHRSRDGDRRPACGAAPLLVGACRLTRGSPMS